VLGRLSAAERTAFVLHDVFGYPFEAVAEIVGRTPAACRQLASRARRTVRSGDATERFAVEPAEHRRVTEAFIAACSGGDLDGLLAVLDPDVDGVTDVGGTVGSRVATGAAEVAGLLLLFLGPPNGPTLLSLPGGDDALLVALRDDRIMVLAALTIRDGRVTHIDGVVDPVKLAPITAELRTG